VKSRAVHPEAEDSLLLLKDCLFTPNCGVLGVGRSAGWSRNG